MYISGKRIWNQKTTQGPKNGLKFKEKAYTKLPKCNNYFLQIFYLIRPNVSEGFFVNKLNFVGTVKSCLVFQFLCAFLSTFLPLKFHFCLIKQPNTAKQVCFRGTKCKTFPGMFPTIAMLTAMLCTLKTTIYQPNKCKKKRCQVEFQLIVTNIYRTMLKKSMTS